MHPLLSIKTVSDIPPAYRSTPIERLLRFHNFKEAFETYTHAELLIGMCMDHRKHLHIPDNFSYIIRSGGANLRHSEFKVSYSISVGRVGHIALIGHNHCGMVNLNARRGQFVEGLVKNAGWDRESAEDHFSYFAPLFEIGNESDFILSESARLRTRYPNIKVAPMMYLMEDNQLYFIAE